MLLCVVVVYTNSFICFFHYMITQFIFVLLLCPVDCLQFGAFINKVVVNTLVRIFGGHIFLFLLDYTPRNRTVES